MYGMLCIVCVLVVHDLCLCDQNFLQMYSYVLQSKFSIVLLVHCHGIFIPPPAPLTSMGLSIRVLQKSAAYTTGSSLVILAAPPTSGSGRGGLFGVQGHSSKALCYNFCYSLNTGRLVSQVDLQTNSQLHCALTRGASADNMGGWVGVV